MDWILDERERVYYLNLREFASGAFEAVIKTVRPMQMDQIKRQYESHGAISASASVERARKAETDPEAAEFDRQANHRRAVRRAKQNIRWLCKVLEADRLFTLTYRENIQDREQVKSDFKRFLRLVRARFPKWAYVAVLEKQERGAFHIHCAVKGWQYVSFLRECWHKALGCPGTMSKEQSPGNVDVTRPDKRFGNPGRQWKTEKLAGYICKYLHKTFDEDTSEKNRYWRAKDLHVPAKQRFWIGAQNIIDAIYETRDLLRLHVGLKPGYDMWLSDTEDSFWMAGRGS